jgi:hypothetical protein
MSVASTTGRTNLARAAPTSAAGAGVSLAFDWSDVVACRTLASLPLPSRCVEGSPAAGLA